VVRCEITIFSHLVANYKMESTEDKVYAMMHRMFLSIMVNF